MSRGVTHLPPRRLPPPCQALSWGAGLGRWGHRLSMTRRPPPSQVEEGANSSPTEASWEAGKGTSWGGPIGTMALWEFEELLGCRGSGRASGLQAPLVLASLNVVSDIGQAPGPGWASTSPSADGRRLGVGVGEGASAGCQEPPGSVGPGLQLRGGSLRPGPRPKFPHWKGPRDHRAAPGTEEAQAGRAVREVVAGPGAEPRLLCWPRVTPRGLLRLPAAFPAQSCRLGRADTALEPNRSPLLPPGGHGDTGGPIPKPGTHGPQAPTNRAPVGPRYPQIWTPAGLGHPRIGLPQIRAPTGSRHPQIWASVVLGRLRGWGTHRPHQAPWWRAPPALFHGTFSTPGGGVLSCLPLYRPGTEVWNGQRDRQAGPAGSDSSGGPRRLQSDTSRGKVLHPNQRPPGA